MAYESDTLKKKLLECLEKTHGIVTDACKMCNCSRYKFYDFLKKDDDFKTKVDEIQNVTLDFVENKLFENIEKGYTAEILFFLKTKGKNRGYIETKELTDETKSIVKAKIWFEKNEND